MTLKKELKIWLFAFIVVAVVYTFTALMIGIFERMINVPAQTAQVEVVDKRISQTANSDSALIYYITFKFPDSSVREFRAGRPAIDEHYDAINVGDTGKLTYRENENKRRFERFEADPAFGGVIVEPYRQDDKPMDVLIILTFVAFIPVCAMVFRHGIVQSIINKSPEQYAQVQVVYKRMKESRDFDGGSFYSYYATFKFSGDSQKEFEIGTDCKENGKFGRVYDSIYMGDTGELTYKESEEIVNKIKDEELLYEGRRFIKFDKDK
jgi:hypothetical protein